MYFLESTIQLQSVDDNKFWNVFQHRLYAKTNYLRAYFHIRPSLAGIAGAVSFASATRPNYFLRHQNHKMFLHPYNSGTLYKKDASFREIKETGGVRFQSVNYPKFSLAAQHGRIAIVQYNTARNKRLFLWRKVTGKP